MIIILFNSFRCRSLVVSTCEDVHERWGANMWIWWSLCVWGICSGRRKFSYQILCLMIAYSRWRFNDSGAARDVVFHDTACAWIHTNIQGRQRTGYLLTDTSTSLCSNSLHYEPITSRDVMKKIHTFVAYSPTL